MGRLITNGRRPLLIPGTAQRALRRPDPRGLIVPQPSAAPMHAAEVDYDDLDIVRTWRTYEPNSPGQVRYFCYELAQRDPHGPEQRYYKAVRLIRLTRVPRYLRNTGSGGGEVFGAMRDVLVGLREKRVLFLNMIAKSPTLPLVFAYGVQAAGDTIEEACAKADDAYAALSVALDGTYQQLEYQPLSLTEGESLARYQAEWSQIAMARGRPMPQGIALGSSGILDGNRTDAENTNNQLEAFIRGMGDRSFMLSMVTAPLSPEAMTAAWRNISKNLSKVRSDQQGSRGVSAGIALPLGTGVTMGEGTGNTHGVTGTHGLGSTDGASASASAGSSFTHTDSTSNAVTNTAGVSASQSVSDTHAVATAAGQSVGASESTSVADGTSRSDSANVGQSYAEGTNQGVSTSVGQSYSESVGASQTQGVGVSESRSASQGVSVGASESLSRGASISESNSVSVGQTATAGQSAGSNWSQNAGQSVNAGQTATQGQNMSLAESLQQTWNLTYGENSARGASQGGGETAQISGNLFTINSALGESSNWGQNEQGGRSAGGGVSQSGGATQTNGISNSFAQTLGQTLSLGESLGGSLTNSQSLANSVGQSQGVTSGQSVSSTVGQSASQSQSVGHSVGQSASLANTASVGQSQGVTSAQGATMGTSQSIGSSQGIGQTLGQSQTLATANSLSQGQSLTQSVSDGRTVGTSASQSLSQGVTQGVGASDARGVSATHTQGASTALSQQQALSDAYMVAASRQVSTAGTLGVVPNVGVNINKATFNEGKRVVGDVLEAQMNRYLDGIEGGGMLYQMFLVCPDRETLVGASSLLKSAFWGAGGEKKRLPSPFHTVIVEDPEEAGRLLTHAAAFSSYRRREPVSQLVEPFMYSTYVTTGEASVFCHPPTHEALGLMANTDSMPVLAMPANRGDRDIYVGRIVDGERGRVSDARFGIDLAELTHILIQGTTGSGKTTTMMRVLEQAARLTKEVVTQPTVDNPYVTTKTLSAGVLALDWMQNFRDLAHVVPADRFQLFSVANPELGAFRFNPLAIPHPSMDPAQWLGAQADQLAASFGLGEYGRSLLSEALDELYRANRLTETELRPAIIAADGSGVVEAPAIVLPAVDAAALPAGAIVTDPYGQQVANVYSHPDLARLVGLPDVATIIARKIGEGATQEAGRLQGTDIRNRLQSVWRRLQYYAPGGPGYAMVAADPDLHTRECLAVTDLIDPDRGLVTVIETDGLDLENRRVILGSVMLAVYRYGLHSGKGCFDHGGKGPGTFIVLEEAHELFGDATEGEDAQSATMRANLYESLFRRARATGLRLVAMTQNCGHVPSAITSMTTTVFIHRTYDEADRKRVADLLNWSFQVGQQTRELKYLGETPKGYCIVRLDAQDSYLESAPIQILVDPPALPPVTDAQLAALAQARRRGGR